MTGFRRGFASAAVLPGMPGSARERQLFEKSEQSLSGRVLSGRSYAPGLPSNRSARNMGRIARSGAGFEGDRYPRRFAAASLKLVGLLCAFEARGGYPRRFAAASLKRHQRIDLLPGAGVLSAAIRRGLIEAL